MSPFFCGRCEAEVSQVPAGRRSDGRPLCSACMYPRPMGPHAMAFLFEIALRAAVLAGFVISLLLDEPVDPSGLFD